MSPFPDPRPELEQYLTPLPVAVELLRRAHAAGHLQGTVADLGCGTGRLALGAAWLGARVTGVELDDGALTLARAAATQAGLVVEWVHGAVENWDRRVTTVVMNPPFGAQRPGADRPFLARALASAEQVWSLHLAESGDFVPRYARRCGGDVAGCWEVTLSLDRTMRHHRQEQRKVQGILYHLRSVR